MDNFDNNQNQQNPNQFQQNPNQFQQSFSPMVDENTRVFTTKDWLLSLLVMLVPCVNIVMAFVWAFGNGNLNRRNFFRAYLILIAIGIVIYFIIFLVFGAAILAGLSSYYSYY